jgi:hypothetical protein
MIGGMIGTLPVARQPFFLAGRDVGCCWGDVTGTVGFLCCPGGCFLSFLAHSDF